jgi:hypothetical protein
MKRKKPSKAWSKKKKKAGLTPAEVMEQLNSRVLVDLETCRKVWETEGNPVAVVEAVRQAELPEWLADALLILLTAEPVFKKPIARSMWEHRDKDMSDAARAGIVAVHRGHPQHQSTWGEIGEQAPTFLTDHFDTPRVSGEAMRASYELVARTLEARPAAYYQQMPGMPDRMAAALGRLMKFGPLGKL